MYELPIIGLKHCEAQALGTTLEIRAVVLSELYNISEVQQT
jgi:hypothetical protein